MSEGLITSRLLQNEVTGIDMHVPLYKEIRGTMMTGHVEYQIIVVTCLAAFKSTKHKPEDIVQLVVSKKYSEIDEFYHRLVAQYPKIILPAMPRKALFVGETDIRERRVAFDELVKFISKNSQLATCPEVLEFLGAKSRVADLKTRNAPDWKDQDNEVFNFFEREEAPAASGRVTKHVSPAKLNEEEDGDGNADENYLGPLGNVKCNRQKKITHTEPKVAIQPLFNEAENIDDDLFQPAAKDSKVKLFEDSDLAGKVKLGDPLLLPTAYKDVASADLGLEEDTDELFRIEDNLDKLLQVKSVKAKPGAASKPKMAPKSKPALPVKPSPISGVAGVPPVAGEVKDQMDILKYIQQNESTANDVLDLF
ncbi:HCLS1-binding protein 3 isoform X2 [Esox lucius]|uniref:PX domain-containing protein n=1 Tax=Esox lucius TaxID=8010 RepID=A0A3P8XRA9_ESOLU|nr:HCLS1-binding protein 3 isoform X2 [Esox lucius]